MELAVSALEPHARDEHRERGGPQGSQGAVNDDTDQLEVSQIFNGTGSDESWRHERVKRQAGGEDKLNFVGDVLWQTVDEIAVKHSDLEV